ncbi:hypothetical protein HDU93_009253 [Gonapodya sp. JEL0774]|nr:hypothetical protein HDU93_009253 [Gonapodya sp. JEL0774]
MDIPSDDLIARRTDSHYILDVEGLPRLKVVRDESHLIDAQKEAEQEEGLEVCMLGSPKHVKALKAKLLSIQKEQEEAAREKRLAEARAEELEMQVSNYEKELLSLARTDTLGTLHTAGDESVPHHSINTFGEQKMELIHSYRGGFRILQPIIRQYFVDRETLVREEEERKTSWSELFFDLVFVVATAAVGHVYINNLRLQDFIFIFVPIWRVWHDMVYFINVFGADDTVQRCLLFWIMLIAVTMAIPTDGSYGGTMSLFYSCFLVSRGTFLLAYISLLAWFPTFLYAFASIIAQIISSTLLWVVGLAVASSSPSSRIAIWWLAVFMDFGGQWILIFIGRNMHRFIPNSSSLSFYPRFALNIEHFSERMGLFVILALGEGLSAIVSSSPTANLTDPIYSKAALGLLAFLSFQTCDPEKRFHRIAVGIVAAASLSVIIQTTDTFIYSEKYATESTGYTKEGTLYPRAGDSSSAVHLTSGIVWSYCGGLGIAMCCVATMMLQHQHDPSMYRFSLATRVGAKYLCAIGITLVGLGGKSLSVWGTLALVGAFILALALMEAYGVRNVDQEYLAEDFAKGEVVQLGRPRHTLWNKNAVKAAGKNGHITAHA